MILSRSVGNLIFKCYRNPLHFSFSLLVIDYTVHFGIFPWSISIFLKKASNSSHALVTATTTLNMRFYLLLIIVDRCSLANNHFAFGLDGSKAVGHSNECLHFVFDSTFCVVIVGFVLNGR